MAYPIIHDTQQATLTTAGTVNVTKPTGTVEGDLLIALKTNTRAPSTTVGFSTPSGWTLIGERAAHASNNTNGRMAWYRKIAGASEPASYSFTNSEGTHHTQRVAIMRITGHDPASPVSENFNRNDTGTTFTSPSVTAVSNESLALRSVIMTGSGVGTAFSASPTMDAINSGTLFGTTNQRFALGSQQIAVAGGSGTAVWAHASGGNWIASTLIINPNPTVPPDAFGVNDWAVANSTIGSSLFLKVASLPASSAAITDIEIRLNGGSAVSTGLTSADIIELTGLTDGTIYSVEVRAVSANGNGAWSAVKTATPSVGAGGGVGRLLGNSLLG